MTITPRRKQCGQRERVRRDRCTGAAGSSAIIQDGPLASAHPPTLTTPNVAMAITNHSRSFRAGSVILVCSQCHPPRLMSLKPHSMMGRSLCQATFACSGARSVRISQGSVGPSSRRASNVPASCASGLDKQVTRPLHPGFPWCTAGARSGPAGERRPRSPDDSFHLHCDAERGASRAPGWGDTAIAPTTHDPPSR